MTFWNFNIFRRREDEVKEADMDPGIEKMMELAKRERMRARMPPVEDVAKALGDFFAAKEKKKQPIPDNQAQLVLQSLRYYLEAKRNPQERAGPEQQGKGESDDAPLSNRHLFSAANALGRHVEPSRPVHVELAKLVYEMAVSLGISRIIRRSFYAYLLVLSRIGSAKEARELALQYEQTAMVHNAADQPQLQLNEDELEDPSDSVEREESEQHAFNPKEVTVAWGKVLQGFVREGNVEEVQRTLEMIRQRGLEQTSSVAGPMIDFCLARDDLPGLRRWWNMYRQREQTFGQRLDKILKWCLARNELDAGHEIVKEVMATNPPKGFWDAIFVWAAGTKKSVDEIDRMMSVMEKSNEAIADSDQWRMPDISTLNGLVEFAISKDDPYMAERFIALGRDRNIEPDARTYVLQMDYRLSVDDVDGALIAYKNLQSMDLSSNEDTLTVNRLIVSLCNSKHHDFDTIMNVAADLSDRRVRFEPLTVSTLALLHLSRDEHRDVLDLLNTHAFHYSTAERESIRDAIIAYAVDPATSISRAWSGYHIIYTIFDETPRPQRTELMTSFFNRERADMGVRIFQNMRMHSRADTIPTVETYAAAFMGLAKLRDLESLEVIHNLLKLDFNVTVNTYLYNALIIAYTACGKARKALVFWEDIVASREGPSYNSIHIALRACERSAFGDLEAKKLWSLLRRRNVELDHSLWCSYIAALAGNGDIDSAINTLEEAVEKGEVGVDALILGNLYAGAPGVVKKNEVEVWAKDAFPEEWSKLEEIGFEEDEGGFKRPKIDRAVAP